MAESVPFKMTEDHARELLNRLYGDRYDDVDNTTVAFEIPVDIAIEELENRFPHIAAEFDHNE